MANYHSEDGRKNPSWEREDASDVARYNMIARLIIASHSFVDAAYSEDIRFETFK